MFRLFATIFLVLATSCVEERTEENGGRSNHGVVSLDYCADQYVLNFVDRDDILALSPNATEEISYFREIANGIPTVRPVAENIIALKPDIVVRSYGGGTHITNILQRSGVEVIQIGWISDLKGSGNNSVVGETQRIAAKLGKQEFGSQITEDFLRNLKAIKEPHKTLNALYLTPSGYTSGKGSIIYGMLSIAGLENFERRKGWRTLPLERLVYEKPDILVTSFFELIDIHNENWSSARHPLVQNLLKERQQIAIESSLVSCGGWWIIDAIKKLAMKPSN